MERKQKKKKELEESETVIENYNCDSSLHELAWLS